LASQSLSTRRPPRWAAYDDGIAHAIHGGLPRAACGIRVQPERFERLGKTRCEACVVAIAFAGGPR